MKLGAVLIFVTLVLNDCGSAKYSEFTVEHPTTLSGQLLDPQGAAVANLKLVLKCGSSTTARVTDSAGKYDFGSLQPGRCKIGTPTKIWLAPEVKCDEQSCSVEKLRLGPMSLT